MYQPEGETIEIDLFYAEIPATIGDQPNNNVMNAYVYEDVWSEEYTRKFHISKTEALSAINS